MNPSDLRSADDNDSVGNEAGGAVAGARGGNVIGLAAGPLGALLAGVPGGFVGTKTAGNMADALVRDKYMRHFDDRFRTARYYRTGSDWKDYRPAYQYAYDQYARNPGQRFERLEEKLGRDWTRLREGSGLGWSDAREAVRDGWDYLANRQPAPFMN